MCGMSKYTKMGSDCLVVCTNSIHQFTIVLEVISPISLNISQFTARFKTRQYEMQAVLC